MIFAESFAMKNFPIFRQLNLMDCGPTCLKMVAKFHGKNFSLNTLRNYTEIGKEGVNLLGISDAAEKIGCRSRGVKLTVKELLEDAPKPCILHWEQNHFVVLPPQKANGKVVIADPAKGMVKIDTKEFAKRWASTISDNQDTGIALLIEPTPAFYEQAGEREHKISWGFLLSYLKQQKKLILQLVAGLLVGSLLQLIFPFLTQSIVDTGINTHNLQFIYLVLIAQFMLFFGRTTVDFIRSRILLYISTRINVSLLSDFWIKMMKLPLNFFDTRQTGDILQRIQDQEE